MAQLFNHIKIYFKLILATGKVITIPYIWICMLKQWEEIALIEQNFLDVCILDTVVFLERKVYGLIILMLQTLII